MRLAIVPLILFCFAPVSLSAHDLPATAHMTEAFIPFFEEEDERVDPDRAWSDTLSETLSLERLVLAQLSYDSSIFGALWPYLSAIRRQGGQIRRLEELMKGRGESGTRDTPAIRIHQLLSEAYETAVEYEKELIRRYEWLIAHTSDIRSKKALKKNLFHSRVYHSRFNTAAGNIPGYM